MRSEQFWTVFQKAMHETDRLSGYSQPLSVTARVRSIPCMTSRRRFPAIVFTIEQMSSADRSNIHTANGQRPTN